jgi:hypothetical protein
LAQLSQYNAQIEEHLCQHSITSYIERQVYDLVQRPLRPENGKVGRHIIAEGVPEAVAGVNESYTGRSLRQMLSA